MKLSEYIPEGWRLQSIAHSRVPSPHYAVTLSRGAVTAQASDPDLDDALQLACLRAREFPAALLPHLGKLASVRRQGDIWILTLPDGTIAGHCSPVRALEMLGLEVGP